MAIFSTISDAIRGQPASHKVKREYVFSDHHSDILGTGGYSRVERVKSLKLNKYVAMKIVNKSAISNKAAYLRLLYRLHEMYEDLQDDYMIRSYQWFESLDRYYVAFELAEGGDMFDRITNMGRYTERDAQGALKRILTALDFLHNQGMIHRDIKPENFFYRDIKDPLAFGMADFGLALVLEKRGPGDSERFYEVAGTPGYAAPEVYKKTGYGKKSDLFGVGVTGYIMLSSWSPWSSSDAKQLMIETMTQEVKFYPSHWGGVSDLAKDFITTLTEKNPNKRPNCQEALKHPWLNTPVPEKKADDLPVPQNLLRTTTARPEGYYDGCELARALTKHAEDVVPEKVAA